ncbi:TPA: hypothetical protein ACH3X2_002702 [Trebouxia sp. C0005]
MSTIQYVDLYVMGKAAIQEVSNDVLEYQGKGAQILICSDFNARTAKEPDFLRMADLQPFLPTALDEDELPDYIRQRRKRTCLPQGPRHGVPSYWGSANRLIFSS